MPSKLARSRNDVVFTEKAKELVRKPLGKLLAGPKDKVASGVISILNKDDFEKVIVVGDFSARVFLERKLPADIFIIDGKIERRPVNKPVVAKAVKRSVTNPAGRISARAFSLVGEATKFESPVLIEVKGEEDLLTLAAIVEAPLNSLVFYGQPRRGMVAVEITRRKKRSIERLLSSLQG